MLTAQLEVTDTYRQIKRRVIWCLGAFSIVLAFFAANSLQESFGQRKLASELRNWTELTGSISQAVHELQRERGLSSGYLSSSGKQFSDALANQLARTDRALAALETALSLHSVSMPSWSAGDTVVARDIVETRAMVRDQRVAREVVTDIYSNFIARLFALMSGGAAKAGELLGQEMAFISLLQAKEAAGQERALLTAVLSSGEFGHFSRAANFHQLRAIEETQLEQFNRLADSTAIADLQAIEASDYNQEINKIRRYFVAIAHSSPNPQLKLPAAERWFEVASQRIDAMKALEDRLGASLLHHALMHESETWQRLLVNGLSALTSLLFGAVLLWFVRSGKEQAEASLRLAGKVFRNSVESIVVTDPNSLIIEVNSAFTRISGFSRDEVIGQHVRLMKSGRHNVQFYEAMWQRIGRLGNWEGEVWNRRRNGDIYPAFLSIVEVRDSASNLSNYIAMTVDLSQHKKTEELLEQLRTFDPLTGLLSRDACLSAIDRAIAHTRGSSRQFAIVEIGLDRFKLINDSISHAIGDRVLVEAADRIRKILRRHDAASRPGGDRFSILLEDIDSAQNAGMICEKVLASFVPPIDVDEHRLHVSVSIGVALFPDDGNGASELMRHAEAAMYRAKKEGRAKYLFYSSELNAEGAQVLALEAMLRQALAHNEFTVVYQPQVNLESGHLIGVEALLRWNNPELGPISPVQFIPVAEETGLILPIGDWVLRTACFQARRWMDSYGLPIPVAVNLAARQFNKSDLMVDIQQSLDESGITADMLELEITEGSLITDPSKAVDILRGLRAMGVRTAIDDFGTGYSSLAYLKHFPLDRLKIDRAFVRELPANKSDAAITRTVVELGRHLGMEVLAEGVEEEVQRDFLAQIGCQVVQGYLYGKPMSAEDIDWEIECGRLVLPLKRTA